MVLKIGDRGSEVRHLQLQLKAAGFDPGDIDGFFGKRTLAALTAFQSDAENLSVDGIYGPETAAALEQALVVRDNQSPDPSQEPAPPACADDTWAAFLKLRDLVTSTPVRYGPGRGLFDKTNRQWIITYGPGRLDSKDWRSHLGKTYPSFHCSSWTNFFLGWLLRYNERFTHAGNIPSLFTVLEASPDVHTIDGGGDYRGYGPFCQEIVSDGDTLTRRGLPKALDIRELYARKDHLPTFLVCAESTRTANGWRLWHHTVVFVIDHRTAGNPMYRLAADGFCDSSGYSGRPMEWIEIEEATFPRFDSENYRVYGVRSADGTYGGGAPIFDVVLEP